MVYCGHLGKGIIWYTYDVYIPQKNKVYLKNINEWPVNNYWSLRDVWLMGSEFIEVCNVHWNAPGRKRKTAGGINNMGQICW